MNLDDDKPLYKEDSELKDFHLKEITSEDIENAKKLIKEFEEINGPEKEPSDSTKGLEGKREESPDKHGEEPSNKCEEKPEENKHEGS